MAATLAGFPLDEILPFPSRCDGSTRPYSCHVSDALIPARTAVVVPQYPLDPFGGAVTARGGCAGRRGPCHDDAQLKQGPDGRLIECVDAPVTVSCAFWMHDLRRPQKWPQDVPPPQFAFQLRGGAGCSTEPVASVVWTPPGWGADARGLIVRWQGAPCTQWELWGGVLAGEVPLPAFGENDISASLHETFDVVGATIAQAITGRDGLIVGALLGAIQP